MKQKNDRTIDRRVFLWALCVGASTPTTPIAFAAEAHADSENDDEKRKAQYKANSSAVKAYYRVNSYPK